MEVKYTVILVNMSNSLNIYTKLVRLQIEKNQYALFLEALL